MQYSINYSQCAVRHNFHNWKFIPFDLYPFHVSPPSTSDNHSSGLCLFWTFRINGAIEDVASCVWLLSLSIAFFRLTPAVRRRCSIPSYGRVTVQVRTPHSISPLVRRRHFFHPGTTVGDAGRNTEYRYLSGVPVLGYPASATQWSFGVMWCLYV